MNWIVYHIASGHAFFTGLLFVCCAAACCQSDRATRLRPVLLFLGTTAVALSSTPLAYWFYAVGLVLAVVCLIPVKRFVLQKAAGWLLVTWCLIAALLEFPHHLSPKVAVAKNRTLLVIGDSVTAGMGGNDTTTKWPEILASELKITIQDLSHPGATAQSALKRVAAEQPGGSVAVIEIGGNDILGTTSVADFQKELTKLIEVLAVPDRQLVMIELPLIPFYHEYGRIQRAIAKRNGVALVPKARFLDVLGNKEATVDSIHLTQHGHEQMAKMIRQIIGPAFPRR